MPRPQLTEQRGGLPPELRGNPNSMAEQVKTAIDEDKIAFLLFGISVVSCLLPNTTGTDCCNQTPGGKHMLLVGLPGDARMDLLGFVHEHTLSLQAPL